MRITFADSPGLLVTLLSTGPELKEIVLLQTEETVSIQVYDLKDVRQRLPVAQKEQHWDISCRDPLTTAVARKKASKASKASSSIHRGTTTTSFMQKLWHFSDDIYEY